MTLFAATDGASRGNPGDSGIGVIVRDAGGNVVLTISAYLGKATNNMAEYTALITLLRRMATVPCTRLEVQADSELMVRQVNGIYKVKDARLQRYCAEVQRLRKAAPYEFVLRYVPREQNKDADALANRGIESREPLPAEERALLLSGGLC
ncbi:MAG: ribonuclease HI family protein [Ignavibacteriae bacterium]|nr:ribonuclease HI family protein [Ignavibacteriota bacterium]